MNIFFRKVFIFSMYILFMGETNYKGYVLGKSVDQNPLGFEFINKARNVFGDDVIIGPAAVMDRDHLDLEFNRLGLYFSDAGLERAHDIGYHLESQGITYEAAIKRLDDKEFRILWPQTVEPQKQS